MAPGGGGGDGGGESGKGGGAASRAGARLSTAAVSVSSGAVDRIFASASASRLAPSLAADARGPSATDKTRSIALSIAGTRDRRNAPAALASMKPFATRRAVSRRETSHAVVVAASSASSSSDSSGGASRASRARSFGVAVAFSAMDESLSRTSAAPLSRASFGLAASPRNSVVSASVHTVAPVDRFQKYGCLVFSSTSRVQGGAGSVAVAGSFPMPSPSSASSSSPYPARCSPSGPSACMRRAFAARAACTGSAGSGSAFRFHES